MMDKFDLIWVLEVEDMGDLEAFEQESARKFGQYEQPSQVYVGINEAYFEEATKDIPHFVDMTKKLA